MKWEKKDNGNIKIKAEIPANTSAVLRIGEQTEEMGNGIWEREYVL